MSTRCVLKSGAAVAWVLWAAAGAGAQISINLGFEAHHPGASIRFGEPPPPPRVVVVQPPPVVAVAPVHPVAPVVPVGPPGGGPVRALLSRPRRGSLWARSASRRPLWQSVQRGVFQEISSWLPSGGDRHHAVLHLPDVAPRLRNRGGQRHELLLRGRCLLPALPL